jgi:hypothetical protein
MQFHRDILNSLLELITCTTITTGRARPFYLMHTENVTQHSAATQCSPVCYQKMPRYLRLHMQEAYYVKQRFSTDT